MTRFLVPAGRYFPDLPDTAADEASLVSAALAEIGHGTAWVKVIADFPGLAAGTDAEATYQAGVIARVVAAAHHAGARVAVHSTVPGPGQLIAAGVGSIEHGWCGLDEPAVTDMTGRAAPPGRPRSAPWSRCSTPRPRCRSAGAGLPRATRGSPNCCPWPSGSACRSRPAPM